MNSRNNVNTTRMAIPAFLLALCLTTGAHAQLASYDADTSVLTLDSVSANGRYYSGVSVYLPPGQAWSIVGSPRQISPLLASDAAVYKNGQLTVPRTQIGSMTYDDYVLNLPAGGAMSIAKAGVVSSASSPGYTEPTFPIRSKVKNSTETDSGGELSYALTNGQVWKHIVDEPCMPTGIGTTDPDGYSDVEIYPNPGGTNEGNFRFVTYYPSKAEATLVETCIVAPVTGIFGVSQGPGQSTLSVSSAAVSGKVGESRAVVISGGMPPYQVIMSSPGIADFWFQPDGRELSLKLSQPGDATLTVYDYNKTTAAVTLAVTSDYFYPPSIDGFTEGTSMDVTVLFGSPPYRVLNPLAPYIEITPVGSASTTSQFRLTLASVPATSSALNVGLYFIDANGSTAEFAISNFAPNPNLETELASSAAKLYLYPDVWQTLTITGGRPPLTANNPVPDWFDVSQTGERTFRVRLKSDALLSAIGECSSQMDAIPMSVTDSTNVRMVMIDLEPQMQCDSWMNVR